MRELSERELETVSGGILGLLPNQEGAPINSSSAGEYFSRCMSYTSPSATVGAIWTIGGAFNPYVAWAGVAWAGGTMMLCGLGTIQFAQ